MRRLIFALCIGVLVLPCEWPQPASAQFSPQGIIGAMTGRLRSMLGRLPFRHHHRARPGHIAEATPYPAVPDSHFGDAGPAVWPTAYGDLIGYVFWPEDYREAFRGRGFDVIADTLLQPASRPAEVATSGSAAASDSAGKPNSACDDAADTTVIWPISDIEKSEQLTGAERGALGHLQTALAQALNDIKAGCSDGASQPPRARLQILVQRLWAVRDAGLLVRTPLKEFYNSLNDEQKKQFNAPQSATKSPDAKTADAAKQQYGACAAVGGKNAEHLIAEIAQRVRPTKQQDAALQALRKTTGDMAKLLSASCDPSTPVEPLARLDAADNQLTSMNYAANSMEIALNRFYAQLTGDQKIKFDSLGR